MMFLRQSKKVSLLLLIVLILSAVFIPTAAAQFTITITGVSGSCTATLTISAEAIADPFLLLSSDFGFVLYGGDSAPFAFASVPVSAGLTALDLGMTYTELGSPVPGTISGKVFAVTPPASSVAAIEAGTLIATVTFDISDLEACTGLTAEDFDTVEVTIEGSDSAPVPVFFDGRLNDLDSGSPVVLFPFETVESELGLEVYTAAGDLVLVVSPEAIAAIEECPEVNTLILENEDLGISLWRLSSCEFQLMAPTGEPGKWYIIIFDWLDESTFYISFEIFME